MATWDDVDRLASALPEVVKGTSRGLIAANPDVYFTTPHFNGDPALLVQLDHIDAVELEERLVEAWRTRAPKRLAREYDASTT